MLPPIRKPTSFVRINTSEDETLFDVHGMFNTTSTVFDDKVFKYEVETTPMLLSHTTSLSSLTIDDEPICQSNSQQHNEENQNCDKQLDKSINSQDEREEVKHEVSNELAHDLDHEEENDDEIIAACIEMGRLSKRFERAITSCVFF